MLSRFDLGPIAVVVCILVLAAMLAQALVHMLGGHHLDLFDWLHVIEPLLLAFIFWKTYYRKPSDGRPSE